MAPPDRRWAVTTLPSRLVPIAAALLATACVGSPAPEPAPDPGVSAPPPAPPAACRLDLDALVADTGLTWAVDEATASDHRCVYDPQDAAGTTSREFIVVESIDAAAPDAVDEVSRICTEGSTTPAGTGFVCLLPTGGVYAAQPDGGGLLTIAAAAIPSGTTAEQVGTAFAAQLEPAR